MKRRLTSRILAVVICVAMVFDSHALSVLAYYENNITDIMEKLPCRDSSDSFQIGDQEFAETDNTTNALMKEEMQIEENIDVKYEEQNNESIAEGGSKTLYEVKNMFEHGKYWNHVVEREADFGDILAQYHDNRFADSVSPTPCAHHGDGQNPNIGEYDCNAFEGELQCRGFASRVAYLIYGSKYNTWNKVDISDIKAGDVLIYHRNGDTNINDVDLTNGFGHTVFVTSRDGNIITVGEANISDKNENCNCKISWGRSFDIGTTFKTTVYSSPYELIESSNKFAIDCPEEGSQFKKECGEDLYVQGWVSPRNGLNSIDVYIDDTKKATLTETNSGIYEREDVSFYAKGYRTTINIDELAQGNHTVKIKAYYSGTEVVDLGTRNITIEDKTTSIKVGDNAWARVLPRYDSYIYFKIEIYGTGDMWNNSALRERYDFYELLKDKANLFDSSTYGNDYWVVVKDGITSVGDYAFTPSIKKIDLPSSVKKIGAHAFENTNITQIKLPVGIEEIGDEAFSNCKLKNIFVPGNMKKWGNAVFSQCENLNIVTINEGVQSIGDSTFLLSHINSLSLPSTLKNIGKESFANVTIDELVLPGNLDTIGENAFANSTIASLSIPQSVKKIGNGAFYGCKNLSSVVIDGEIQNMGTGVFACCETLQKVDFKGKLVDLPDETFIDCGSLKTVKFADGLKTIGSYAFAFAGLEDYSIPDTVEEIRANAFCEQWSNNYNPTLKSVTLPLALKRIDSYAFSGCTKLTSVKTKSLNYLGAYAFENCSSLEELIIPEGCKTIGRYAFSNSGIKKVYIPSTVVSNDDSNWNNYDFGNIREGATNVEVLGKSGSYAEQYASLYGYKFTDTNAAPLTYIFLNPSTIDLYVGQMKEIKVSTNTGIIPASGTFITNTAPSVASNTFVSEKGIIRVKGITEGNAVLTVKIGDIEAKAIINVVKPKIKFKDQDGSDIGIAPIDAVYGEKYPELPVPKKDGKIFAGWYTGADYSGTLITSNMIFEVVDILYAAWIQDDEKFRVLVSNEFGYTGEKVSPEVMVYDGVNLLEEKNDYTVSYKNNTKAYTLAEGEKGFNAKKAPSITIRGKGNYNSVETVYFKILPQNINSGVFDTDDIALSATKKNQRVAPTLYQNGKALKNGTDYKADVYKADDTGRDNSLGTVVKDAGDYVVKITGINNFTGTREVSLKVSEELKPVSKLSVAKIANVKYTGNAITPEPVVKDSGKLLTKGTHYTLSYSLNTDIGTGYVLIKGNPSNGYSGTRRVAFKITGTPLGKATVNGLPKSTTYTGNEITYGADTLKLFIKATGTTPQIDLIRDKDYEVSYINNIKAGKATVVLKGLGGYTGTVKKNVRIMPYVITPESDTANRFVVTAPASTVYSKGGAKPDVSVSFKNADGSIQSLKEGTDYTLSYKNNKAVNGTNKPVVTVKGKGNFKSSRNVVFAITAKDIKEVTLDASDVVFKDKANNYITKISLIDTDGKKLSAGTDYDKILEYTYLNVTEVKVNGSTVARAAGDKVEAGDVIPVNTVIQVTATAKMGGNYTGKVSGTYRVTRSSIVSASVGGITAQAYTGKPITFEPTAITVKVNNVALKPYDDKTGEGDFIIKDYLNNTEKGTAKIVLQGVGNYGGTKTVSFKIKAKGFKWWWR